MLIIVILKNKRLLKHADVSINMYFSLLTAHCGRVNIENWFLEPRRDRNVIANKTGQVAAHKYIVAEETARTLHFRIVTLGYHCNTYNDKFYFRCVHIPWFSEL